MDKTEKKDEKQKGVQVEIVRRESGLCDIGKKEYCVRNEADAEGVAKDDVKSWHTYYKRRATYRATLPQIFPMVTGSRSARTRISAKVMV